MFRTVLYSIVLSLAIGQNASLLCKALCDPAAAAPNGYYEEADPSDSSARLNGGHDCDAKAPNGTAFLKEDMRRTAPAPHTDFAIPVACSPFAPTTTAARLDQGPGRPPSLERRPLETALRI